MNNLIKEIMGEIEEECLMRKKKNYDLLYANNLFFFYRFSFSSSSSVLVQAAYEFWSERLTLRKCRIKNNFEVESVAYFINREVNMCASTLICVRETLSYAFPGMMTVQYFVLRYIHCLPS